MEMNPIIGREVRSRWRHWHAFALTLLWAAALVVVVCQSYDSINPYHGTFLDDNAKDFASMSQMTGRELFKMLALVQAGAWLFLAPMLTATGIATERERGLLESLQLSPLTGGQIIRGKLFSALAFISLLMLAALPVMAICFLIGGVSPADLVVATLLQFTTAFCGASIGLFFSSRARRPLAALTQSLVFVALWSFIIYTIGENLYPNPAAPPWWITMIMVILTHPVAGLWAYTAPEGLLTQTLSIPPTSFLTTGFSLWSISFIFQFLLSSALLFAAARKVAKPFHASTPNDRHWSDAWKSRVKNQTERKTAQRETVKIGEKAQSALLCEPPSVDAVIRSNNPILQRQLRGAFRLSRGALWLGLLQAFILIGLSGMFVLAVIETFNKESRVPLFYNIAHSLLFLAVVAGALNGARGFTRERESGTWESI
ncbi:MAG TPA: ABC transporter permease, partial [Abditibacteriaceae bacterium]